MSSIQFCFRYEGKVELCSCTSPSNADVCSTSVQSDSEAEATCCLMIKSYTAKCDSSNSLVTHTAR